jgi:hypothetical protein
MLVLEEAKVSIQEDRFVGLDGSAGKREIIEKDNPSLFAPAVRASYSEAGAGEYGA